MGSRWKAVRLVQLDRHSYEGAGVLLFCEITLMGVKSYGWAKVMALPNYLILHW